MKSWYGRWIENWENTLAFRSTNRVVRHFDWGLEWARNWPTSHTCPQNGHGPEEYVRLINRMAISDSDRFFNYVPPNKFQLEGNLLRFRSPVETPYEENNIVHGQWFPAKSERKKAVVVLPHWNAPGDAHNGLCKGLARLGVPALRLSLPYHDYRMPPELERADYAVSSNICRTIDATRQAVIDIRACFDWLQTQGYERFGIVGTSLGSCYACLASTHDPRIAVNVFNHCSTYVADVVWTGLSTIHIREGLQEHIDLDRLREAWRAISPVTYVEKFAARRNKSLFIYTNYDTTFIPRLSKDSVDAMRQHKVDHRVVVLPCGHYTMGETPFKFLDGYHICSFLKRNL